jgi:hypothetical protein
MFIRPERPFGSGHGIGQQQDLIMDPGGSLIPCGCLKFSAAVPAAGVASKKDCSVLVAIGRAFHEDLTVSELGFYC